MSSESTAASPCRPPPCTRCRPSRSAPQCAFQSECVWLFVPSSALQIRWWLQVPREWLRVPREGEQCLCAAVGVSLQMGTVLGAAKNRE